MGFDVGAVLENLVLNYLSHFAHTPDPETRAEYQDYLLDLVREIWKQFAAKFDALWVENNRGELMPAAYWDYPGGDAAFAEFRRRYAGAHPARHGRARRRQDAAAHDGHRQRVGHHQHRRSRRSAPWPNGWPFASAAAG